MEIVLKEFLKLQENYMKNNDGDIHEYIRSIKIELEKNIGQAMSKEVADALTN